MDWHTVYDQGIVQNHYRNYLITGVAEHMQMSGHKILILIQRIEHGKILLRLLNDPNVVFSYGGGSVCRLVGQDIEEDQVDPETIRQSFDHQTSGILIGCFAQGTQIPLLDGSVAEIQDLVDHPLEFEVYSVNPETRWIEGYPARAFKTGDSLPIVRVELDNGEDSFCTPEHLWMMRDGTYKRADCLSPGTSLMPLYLDSDKGYELLYQPVVDEYIHTHRSQAFNLVKPDYPRIIEGVDYGGWVVHHIDFNLSDNSHWNLQWSRWRDHWNKHQGFGFVGLYKTDPEWVKWKSQLESDRHKTLWSNLEYREMMCQKRKEFAATPVGRLIRRQNMIRWNQSPEKRARTTDLNLLGVSGWSSVWNDSQRTHDLLSKLSNANKQSWQNHRENHLSGVRRGNQSVEKRAWHSEFMKQYWSRRRLNHTVVSVSNAGTGPVYDLQVPFSQNFAIASGSFVHNSTVYDEAIDIPSMNVLIMAGGGKSFRRTVQRIGRPLHSKSDFVHVMDFWDYQHQYLQKHSRQRSAIYHKMEYLQFRGFEELNRRIALPVDPGRIIMDKSRRR